METAIEEHGYQNKSDFARHAVRRLLRVHDARSDDEYDVGADRKVTPLWERDGLSFANFLEVSDAENGDVE